MESKKYKIIYCDCPWKFNVWSDKGKGKSAEKHYPTQDADWLKKMNVPSISEDNSVLLMWATFPCLKEAIELGEHWGFIYKTVAFTWVKKNTKSDTPFVGMGYYTRANAEIVLLFTKGKPLKRYSKAVQQILFENEAVYSKIGKHSQKPPEIRNRIVELFGNIPRVELFARSREGFFPDFEYSGWDTFGNECNKSIKI